MHNENNVAGFNIEVINPIEKSVESWSADRVIYAGQKHALKYVFPEEAPLFDKNEYAPWMVINYVGEQKQGKYGFWQNEYLGEEPSFLGFIDSSVQDQGTLKGNRVYTAYHCLKPSDREYLKTIPDYHTEIVQSTQSKIEAVLGKSVDVREAHIHVMGHAMAIPAPGFLFPSLSATKLKYAGVDAGRLPLLFEALDSGLQAAEV